MKQSKIISALLSFTMGLTSLGSVPVTVSVAETVTSGTSTLSGDMNCDLKIDKQDRNMVIEYCKALEDGRDYKVSEQGKKNADMNKDGVIDKTDADLIDEIILKSITREKEYAAGSTLTTTSKAVTTTITTTTATSETPSVATTTVSFILPERNENVTTVCVSNDTSPVWDDQGHYRGTNALYDAYLEIKSVTTVPAVVDSVVDLSNLKVVLVEKRRFNIYEHDVSGMLNIADYDYMDSKNYYVDIGTDYKLSEYGFEIKPIRLIHGSFWINGPQPVSSTTESVTSSTTTSETIASKTISTNAVSFILPAYSGTVTTVCVSDSPIPVRDDEGHYRGTNALYDVRLETRAVSAVELPIKDTVDLSDLRVVLVEERRFNIYEHDVSGRLSVKDYGYLENGNFFVDVITDYKIEHEAEPLRIEFKESGITTGSATVSSTTSTTTATSATTVNTTPINSDKLEDYIYFIDGVFGKIIARINIGETKEFKYELKNGISHAVFVPITDPVSDSEKITCKSRSTKNNGVLTLGDKGIGAGKYTIRCLIYKTVDAPNADKIIEFTLEIIDPDVARCDFCGKEVPKSEIIVGPISQACKECYEKANGYIGGSTTGRTGTTEPTGTYTTETTIASDSITSSSITTESYDNIEGEYITGDSNCDGELNMADAVLIMQSIANPSKFGDNGTDKNHITAKGKKNADIVGNNDGITNLDALAIQKILLKLN